MQQSTPWIFKNPCNYTGLILIMYVFSWNSRVAQMVKRLSTM